MDTNIYEVTKTEYKAFIEQLIPGSMKIEEIHKDNCKKIRLISKKTKQLICERIVTESETQYFIYTIPDDEERRAPIPKLQLQLNSREEVQNFFNLISNLKND